MYPRHSKRNLRGQGDRDPEKNRKILPILRPSHRFRKWQIIFLFWQLEMKQAEIL